MPLPIIAVDVGNARIKLGHFPSNARPSLPEPAGTLEADGRGSGNPVFEDYATTAAQYFRAFGAAAPNYADADRNLGMAGVRLDTLISAACQAAAAQ